MEKNKKRKKKKPVEVTTQLALTMCGLFLLVRALQLSPGLQKDNSKKKKPGKRRANS